MYEQVADAVEMVYNKNTQCLSETVYHSELHNGHLEIDCCLGAACRCSEASKNHFGSG